MNIRKQHTRRTVPTDRREAFTRPDDVFAYGAFLPRTLTNFV